jgi:cell division protein ZapB
MDAIDPSPSAAADLEPLLNRVDRLLLRHEELQRTNALLLQQLESLTRERDSLLSRLQAARARVDALLLRLPEAQTQPTAAHTPSS